MGIWHSSNPISPIPPHQCTLYAPFVCDPTIKASLRMQHELVCSECRHTEVMMGLRDLHKGNPFERCAAHNGRWESRRNDLYAFCLTPPLWSIPKTAGYIGSASIPYIKLKLLVTETLKLHTKDAIPPPLIAIIVDDYTCTADTGFLTLLPELENDGQDGH